MIKSFTGKQHHCVCLSVLCCIICCILSLNFQLAAASGQAIDDPDHLYDFASSSYEQGDYMTAMVEFKRFVFFFPDDPRADEAAFKIGMSNFHEGRYSQAIDAFEAAVKKYGASEYAVEAVFMLSQSYLKLNDTETALNQLQLLAGRTARQDVRDRALYRIGWLYLQDGDLSSARAAFASISEKNQALYRIEDVMERLDEPKELPYKSPMLAGLYSIIPGGGYFYTGRYKDGLIAFLINAGLAAAAYEHFDHELYATGGLISMVNLGFYSGSIYGGINAAQKHNQRVYDDFVDNLKMEITPNLSFHVEPKPTSLFFSLKFTF